MKNFRQVAVVVAVSAAARLAALYPLTLSADFGGRLPGWLSWLFVVMLYIALVIPLRFWGRETMRRFFYSRKQAEPLSFPYEKWVKAGLLRSLRGILWGLPFLICMGYLMLGQSMDVKTFEMPLNGLSTLLGGNVLLALILISVLIALFGLLFAYGWWRDMATEFLPVRSMKTEKVIHWARRLYQGNKKEYRKNARVNCLLALPAILGFGAVLGLYLTQVIDFSLSLQTVGTLVLRTLRSPLPRLVMFELAAVFLLLYLPLCVGRKMRDAALIAHLLKHPHHHHHHHESESGEDAPAEENAPEDGREDHEA